MTAVSRSGASPAVAGIFGFETDFAGTLHCIPMSVRMKLDQTGIKLSLKQWNKIPSPERSELLGRSCNDPAQAQGYRQFLIGVIEKYSTTPVEFAPVEESPAWAHTAAVPRRVCDWARGLGVAAPSGEQWAALSPLERFTLFKLTRPGHSNENFLPAMREFSLVP